MNSRLAIAALAVVLLAGALWLSGALRSDRSAQPLAASGQSAELPEEPRRTLRPEAASAAAVEAPADSAPEARSESESTPAHTAPEGIRPADPVQCLVYGRVLDSDGLPIDSPTRWVSFTDSMGERQSTRANEAGGYSITGLVPGDWWVSVLMRGYRPVEEQLRLTPDQPVVRKDFTLEASVVIKVRLETSDGRPAMAALREAQVSVDQFVPVATREPPGDTFTEVRGSLNNRFGVGSFWGNGYYFDPLPPEYYGVIVIEGDLPVHVSLVHNQIVLETKRVEPGSDEVAFVLDPETIRASQVSVRLRVVDAESGEPLEGIGVNLRQEGTYRSGTATDAQGDVAFDNREPGLHTLTIAAQGYAQHQQTVDAAPGANLDLGTIALEQETWIAGHCVDAAGKPVAETRLMLARVLPDGKQDQEAGAVTDASGAFRFAWLARGRYVIATYGDDEFSIPGRPFETLWVSGNVVVETYNGPVEDLELRLVAPTPVSIQGTKEAGALRFAIVDHNGLWLRRQRLSSTTPKRLKLPPGSYVLKVTNADGELVEERPFTVGAEPLTLVVSP